MIYSCFNEKLGLYEYYEDDRHHPTNGDLPVPKLPPVLGNVGASARAAGRTLPLDARRRGTGWHARGIVVSCAQQPVRGLQGAEEQAASIPYLRSAAIVLAAGVATYVGFRIFVTSMGAR